VEVLSLWTLVGLNVLLWAMITYETVRVYDERRYRLRHGLDVEVPGPVDSQRTG